MYQKPISSLSGFAPSQWETALHCNDASHRLGASLGSAMSLCSCWAITCKDMITPSAIAREYPWHLANNIPKYYIFQDRWEEYTPNHRSPCWGQWYSFIKGLWHTYAGWHIFTVNVFSRAPMIEVMKTKQWLIPWFAIYANSFNNTPPWFCNICKFV